MDRGVAWRGNVLMQNGHHKTVALEQQDHSSLFAESRCTQDCSMGVQNRLVLGFAELL